MIEAEASRALAEMRAMVRVLRRNLPAEMTPSPRIGDLEQLAGRMADPPAATPDGPRQRTPCSR